MATELAFEKKHTQRVLPTRSLGNGGKYPSSSKDARAALHEKCREVVARCGPWPYLYAEKHAPLAMNVMGAVERELWPDSKNVPASVPSLPSVSMDALLFRTFRHEVGADAFVRAWAETDAARAVEVFAALDDFDVVLAWGLKPLVHIDVETKTRHSIATRGTMFRTLGSSVELPVSRVLRELLAGVDTATYERAVTVARAIVLRPDVTVWTLSGLAFAFPDEPDLVHRAVEALLGTTSEKGLDRMARDQWLRWMLSVPLPPGDAVRILDAIEDQLACARWKDANPVFTWIVLEHAAGRLDALVTLLESRARKHLSGRGWATARAIVDGLVALRGDTIVALVVEHVGHKAFEKAGPEYVERHADLAFPRLATLARTKGKYQKRAEELARILAQKFPSLESPTLDVGGTGASIRKEHETAKESQVPRVLVHPPWNEKQKKAAKPARDVATLPYEDAVDFERGEQEAWAQVAKTTPWLADARASDPFAPGSPAHAVAYTLRDTAMRQALLSLRGLAAIEPLLVHAEERGMGGGLEPMRCIDSPRIAKPMARLAVEATSHSRRDAQVALVRHPRAAAIGLVPFAAQGDAHAREGLRLLILAGASAVVREVIAASGKEAERALADLLVLAPESIVPSKVPALPKFFLAEGFPPPVLVTGEALSGEAVASLGALLRISETLFPHPGLAQVRASCTQASLDAFVWALLRAWEHAKAPEAQSFAAIAVGHLGSERALRTLADEVSVWEKKKKLATATILLEAFAASPLPLAPVLLGRISTESRDPNLRLAAERWLGWIQSARGIPSDLLTLAFPTYGFEHGDVTIEGDFTASIDLGLGLSLRRGKNKGAPKDLSADGLARWSELKDGLADTRAAIVHRLELALSNGERFDRATYVRTFVEHPLVRRLAEGLVVGAEDIEGNRVAFRRRADGTTIDATGTPISIEGAARFGVLHPLELDALGDHLRDAFRKGLAGIEPCVEQLDRDTFPPPSTWPEVRGTVVPYRRLERLMDRRGFRLYRTHCSAPLHDASYLQKTVDGGKARISIGFNFGQNFGDSVLGEVIGQDEDGASGIRHGMKAAPVGISAVALSELCRDLASLTK